MQREPAVNAGLCNRTGHCRRAFAIMERAPSGREVWRTFLPVATTRHGVDLVACVVCRKHIGAHATAEKDPKADAPMCDRCVFTVMDGRHQHVVAVAVVRVEASSARSLMVKRPEGVSEPLQWHDPGGNVELMESYSEAASRQMNQEVNLPMETVLREVATWLVPNVARVMHLFVADAPAGWEPVLKEGQPTCAWVSFSERTGKKPQLATVERITYELKLLQQAHEADARAREEARAREAAARTQREDEERARAVARAREEQTAREGEEVRRASVREEEARRMPVEQHTPAESRRRARAVQSRGEFERPGLEWVTLNSEDDEYDPLDQLE